MKRQHRRPTISGGGGGGGRRQLERGSREGGGEGEPEIVNALPKIIREGGRERGREREKAENERRKEEGELSKRLNEQTNDWENEPNCVVAAQLRYSFSRNYLRGPPSFQLKRGPIRPNETRLRKCLDSRARLSCVKLRTRRTVIWQSKPPPPPQLLMATSARAA